MGSQPADEVYVYEIWGKDEDNRAAVQYEVATSIKEYGQWIKMADLLGDTSGDGPLLTVVMDGAGKTRLAPAVEADDDPVWTDV
jgi:hypothetical protein